MLFQLWLTMNLIVEQNQAKIEMVILNEEETKAALFEGKKKKYFHVKHEAYWIEQEKIKPKH